MISAFANQNQPPLMSAEAQEHAMPFGSDPKRNKVAMALMGQQIGKMGGMFAPQPMTRQESPMDIYGQSPMLPPAMSAGPVSAPMAPQPDAPRTRPSPFQQAMAGMESQPYRLAI
jgi:hypothetical protein